MISSPIKRTQNNGIALQTLFLPYDFVKMFVRGLKENQTEKIVAVMSSWL